MVTVARILHDPGLKLELLHGGDGLEAIVSSAHVSELEDPTPWLQGGEFLMTTGMSLDLSSSKIETYLRRLKGAGVSALAIGLGIKPEVEEIPRGTVEAARAVDLPLTAVPAETPFIAVTKVVYAALAAEQHDELARTLAAQQDLLSALSARKGGFQTIADVLHARTHQWVLILDKAGSPVSYSPEEARAMLKDAVADFGSLTTQDLRSSTSISEPARSILVQPFGVRAVRGFLVCGSSGATGNYERVVNAAASSVLSVESERLAAQRDARRLQDSIILRRLLSHPVSRTRAEDLMSDLRLHYDRVCVVAVESSSDKATQLVERVSVAIPDVRPLQLDSSVLIMLVVDPQQDLGEVVSRAVEGVPVGLGGVVAPEFASTSLRQARYALNVGRRAGQSLVESTRLGSARLLLGMADRDWLQAYADAALSALDVEDSENLVMTLHAFLEANGVADLAASRLGIHRHTLRRRISRVEELTGRDLQMSHDRLDLWLALEARAMSTVAFEDLMDD